MEEPRIMKLTPFLYALICAAIATWFSGCQLTQANETSRNISTSLKADILGAPTDSQAVAVVYKNHPTAIEKAMIHALGGSVFGEDTGNRQLLVELKGHKIKALARHKQVAQIVLVKERGQWATVAPTFRALKNKGPIFCHEY